MAEYARWTGPFLASWPVWLGFLVQNSPYLANDGGPLGEKWGRCVRKGQILVPVRHCYDEKQSHTVLPWLLSPQSGLHSKTSTVWWMWGAYDLTCSLCWTPVFHGLPVMSCSREAMWMAVPFVQAPQTSLSLLLGDTSPWSPPKMSPLYMTGTEEVSQSVIWCGAVTFWWICNMPPVLFLSSRQATGQPSAELGIRPKFTRSARLHNGSWKKHPKRLFSDHINWLISDLQYKDVVPYLPVVSVVVGAVMPHSI